MVAVLVLVLAVVLLVGLGATLMLMFGGAREAPSEKPVDRGGWKGTVTPVEGPPEGAFETARQTHYVACPACTAMNEIRFLSPGEKATCKPCGNTFVVP